MPPNPLPSLPAKAAYITINNPARRNALSLAVLRSLKSQLLTHTTSPVDGRPYLLPPFRPSLLPVLEAAAAHLDSPSSTPPPPDLTSYAWLLSSSHWQTHRASLPSVLVLATDAASPVFSSGHDLGELASLGPAEVKETFALCAEVMRLLRRFPGPVVSRVHGLATAAGAQLALSADVALAARGTTMMLPGAALGLPCTSPVTAVARRAGNAAALRMKALPDAVPVEALGGAVEVVEQGGLDARLAAVVDKLAACPAMPAALGKWAFFAQAGIRGEAEDGCGGDGYEDAAEWAGRCMALHARGEEAREGMRAFLEKRKPVWKT